MAETFKSIAPQQRNGALPAPFSARSWLTRWGIPILIVWLALFLRVWQLDVLPPGLHYDEAFNGTMARDVLRNVNRPVFFTPNFGEEPLHIYTEAALFALVGESPWTIRLVSALFGVVFVAAMFACARALFPASLRLALVAMFMAATLYWAINFSRIGIETNGLPMVLTLSAAALAYAYRTFKWEWVVGAGFLIGATLYTYLASRVWLLVVVLWFAYLVILHRASVRQHLPKWIGMGLVTLLTLAPLGIFFLANPVALSGRSGTVIVLETFLQNVGKTAGMFFLSGDLDPRDNLVGRPALDLILAAVFVLGLALAVVRFRKPFYALLLIWFVVMCLPSALTEFAPNFRRAIGAMPATTLFCALGIDWLWSRLAGRETNAPILKWAVPLAIVALLGVSALLSVRSYFVDWAAGRGLFYSFDAGLLKVGQLLAARPRQERLYLTPDYDEHYTLIWALDGRPLTSFDGRALQVLPDSSRAATYGIITREDTLTPQNIAKILPNLRQTGIVADLDGAAYATVLESPGGAARNKPAGSTTYGKFADLIAVSADSNMRRGEPLNVALSWLADMPAGAAYTVFVQLVGPPNPATGSIVWAQADGQPGNGTYPTNKWEHGDVISENYPLAIPMEAPPGKYQLVTGMYLLETNERVPLKNDAGTRIENNALLLQTFELK